MGTPTRLSVAAIAAILSACATPYKPESALNQGGYSEERREPGSFYVWFLGNERTSEDRAEELATLRAAELCLGEGKPHMRTSDFKTTSTFIGVRAGSTVLALQQTPQWNGNPYMAPQVVGFVPARGLYAPRSGLKVECLAKNGEETREAAVVAASVRERYGIKPSR